VWLSFHHSLLMKVNPIPYRPSFFCVYVVQICIWLVHIRDFYSASKHIVHIITVCKKSLSYLNLFLHYYFLFKLLGADFTQIIQKRARSVDIWLAEGRLLGNIKFALTFPFKINTSIFYYFTILLYFYYFNRLVIYLAERKLKLDEDKC